MKNTLTLIILLSATIFGQSDLLNLLDGGTVLNAIDTPPQNLVATGGTDEVILTWDENTAPDLYGYVIYRDSLGDELVTSDPAIIAGQATLDITNYTQFRVTKSDGDAAQFDVTSYTNLLSGHTYYFDYSWDGDATVTGSSATYDGSGFIYFSTFPQDILMLGNGNYYISRIVVTGGAGTYLDFNTSVKERVISTANPDIAIDTVLAGTETFTNTGLTTGTTYNYRVKALDIEGNLSDYSAKAEGVPE